MTIIVILGVLFLNTNLKSATSTAQVKTTQTQEYVNIGFLMPISGSIAGVGESALNSVNLAIDEINSSGGVNEKKFNQRYQN